jgi:hypothetical protein
VTSIRGQATAEYAGLLALAAVLGATLALVAGPPLASAIGHALVALLPGPAGPATPLVPTAADIADVQAALLPGEAGMTPDAALLALGRRHGAAAATEIADAVLLASARRAAPWIGARHYYRAWKRIGDGPYEGADTVTGDHDVEEPTGSPQVTWITVGDQRRALAGALAHDTSLVAVALDAAGLIPGGGSLRTARTGARLERAQGRLLLPRAIGDARSGSEVVDLVHTHGEAIPPGMLSGDVMVSWPVHRTFWRGGTADASPRIAAGATTFALTAQNYWHRVFLRPGAGGLAVVAEGIGA